MDLHRSVTEFFREALTAALSAKHVEPGAMTEFYLVNLLAEFTTAARVDDEPLALKMGAAAEGTPETRARALKEVGDTSLYVSGFFAESLARRLVDIDYYIAMGGSAYSQLSHLITGHRGVSAEVFREAYGELGERFATFVEVLGEVRAATDIPASTNVVRLCEEWLRTGSERAERRLRAQGLLSLDALKNRKLTH